MVYCSGIKFCIQEENKGADQLHVMSATFFLYMQKAGYLLKRLIHNYVVTAELSLKKNFTNEPHCEKNGLRGFRPGPIQTRLYSHMRWLEA